MNFANFATTCPISDLKVSNDRLEKTESVKISIPILFDEVMRTARQIINVNAQNLYTLKKLLAHLQIHM